MAILRIAIPDIAPKGLTTVLIFVLFFGSLNLFGIGLVGEYIAKIITEVKARPRLIRASITRNGEIVNMLPDGKI
jgi:dolichol-phosphate mannosyltransferase